MLIQPTLITPRSASRQALPNARIEPTPPPAPLLRLSLHSLIRSARTTKVSARPVVVWGPSNNGVARKIRAPPWVSGGASNRAITLQD